MSRWRSTPRRLQGQSRAVTCRNPGRARLSDRTGSGSALSDRMCCALLRARCDSAGAARCLCGMCVPSRAGEGRRLRVGACACARMSVRARMRIVMVVLVVMVDSRCGAGWDREFPESEYPDKGPRKLGDGVTGAVVVGAAVVGAVVVGAAVVGAAAVGAAVVGTAVVGAVVLVVVHSGWLPASRPPVVSGLK